MQKACKGVIALLFIIVFRPIYKAYAIKGRQNSSALSPETKHGEEYITIPQIIVINSECLFLLNRLISLYEIDKNAHAAIISRRYTPIKVRYDIREAKVCIKYSKGPFCSYKSR